MGAPLTPLVLFWSTDTTVHHCNFCNLDMVAKLSLLLHVVAATSASAFSFASPPPALTVARVPAPCSGRARLAASTTRWTTRRCAPTAAAAGNGEDVKGEGGEEAAAGDEAGVEAGEQNEEEWTATFGE